jgi:histone H3/H4
MSRQRIGDLSKKLGLKEKPIKISTKKSELTSKHAEPNYKFQSRVKASVQDEHISDFGHQETEHHDLIPSDSSNQTIQPSLTQEELEDFSLENEHQNHQDDETSSIHSFMKDPRREVSTEETSRHKTAIPKRSYASDLSNRGSRVRNDDEESVMSFQDKLSYEEEPIRHLPSVAKPVRASAIRETIDRGETVPRQAIIRLIRSSNLNSAGADLVDAVKELIVEFTKTVFESTVDPQHIVSASNLHKYIATFIHNEDKDLNNDVIISPGHFERLIRPIIDEKKYIVKRDTFFLLHLFVETILIKVLQGSDMVADAAKRQRVSAKDVLVSYSIYMM